MNKERRKQIDAVVEMLDEIASKIADTVADWLAWFESAKEASRGTV